MRTGNKKWLLLFLIVVIPNSSPAQTRLFQPGDSGVVTSLDFLLISEYFYGDKFGVLRGSYTHRGLWDLGLEYGDTDLHSDTRGFAFFGNFAVINPKPEDRWGLEAGLRYSNHVSQWNVPVRGFFVPPFDRVRHRNIIPGLMGFFRNAEASWVIGLGTFYRFRKYEVLNTDDEVQIGYNYDELGFDFDIHARIWGAMHLSVEMEYSQYKYLSWDRWEASTVFSLGFLFGRHSNDGGDSHE